MSENVPSQSEAAEEVPQPVSRNGRRTRQVLGVLALVVILAVVPSLISIKHYQGRITELMAAALGRPVHLSAVQMRLLPRPGFVLYDLIVDDDPAFGAEPILHANSVTASIRLWSLWRGRLEISDISVDEASLNLVRTAQGRWNVDPFFRTATTMSGEERGLSGMRGGFPSLEATNSRINIKQGAEKLPYSLMNTKLSFSQGEPGSWRVRLRGEPVRTDLSMESADTGEVVLDATLHRAGALRLVPIELQMEWRKAQLGQLTRLVLGTDAGWRGDMTGNLSMTGTAGDAKVKARLRASNVHRAEFVPSSPMDFDANCSFNVHAIGRTVDQIVCDSPVGNGQVHLNGSLREPTATAETSESATNSGSQLSIQFKQIPAEVGLDALRTVRAELLPGIEAKGTLNGHLAYTAPMPPVSPSALSPNMSANKRTNKSANSPKTTHATPHATPLSGRVTVDGLVLSGPTLGSSPIQIAKIQFEPVADADDAPLALTANLPLAAGEPTPLTVSLRFERTGYRVTARGTASTARALQLASAAGIAPKLNSASLQGGSILLDLAAEGSWVDPVAAHPDHLTGTATLRNTRWSAPFLANPVELSSAILRFTEAGTGWEAASFTYGALKGMASLTLPPPCPVPCTLTKPTPAQFVVQMGVLDAASLEAALLGAQKKDTLLESLLTRLRPSTPAAWPFIEGVVKADVITLGPFTLTRPTVALRIQNSEATLSTLDARLLGGTIHATGNLTFAAGRPTYAIQAQCTGLKPAEMGKLVAQTWSGASLTLASTDLTMQGFTGKELAATAHGSLHFDWDKGRLASTTANPVPVSLADLFGRFDRWTGDAVIGNGNLTIGRSLLARGQKKATVTATIPLSAQSKIHLTTAQPKLSSKIRNDVP